MSLHPVLGTTPTTRPLQVTSAPRPGDARLLVHVAPDAPLGCIEVQLGYGKGSAGRGRRPLDDARRYAAILRRIAAHLSAYASDYEAAATEDTQDA